MALQKSTNRAQHTRRLLDRETDPTAAAEAITMSLSIDDIDTILVMTDGISAGHDEYHVPTSIAEAITIAHHSTEDLVDLVHETEASDPHCVRWPRPSHTTTRRSRSSSSPRSDLRGLVGMSVQLVSDSLSEKFLYVFKAALTSAWP